MSNNIPTWSPLLHGNVIRGWQVSAANASVAQEMIEAMMLEEYAFSLAREWRRCGRGVCPEGDEDAVVPGAIA